MFENSNLDIALSYEEKGLERNNLPPVAGSYCPLYQQHIYGKSYFFPLYVPLSLTGTLSSLMCTLKANQLFLTMSEFPRL